MEGYYEKVGDVMEWRWDEGHAPAVAVAEGEFDPREKVEPKPRRAEPKEAAPKKRKASTKAKKK